MVRDMRMSSTLRLGETGVGSSCTSLPWLRHHVHLYQPQRIQTCENMRCWDVE